MDKHVVLRCSQSGVWFGRVPTVCERAAALELTGAPGSPHVLMDARRGWSWEGALACGTLAAYGPGEGSRVEAAVEFAIIDRSAAGGDEVLVCSREAVATWRSAPIAK